MSSGVRLSAARVLCSGVAREDPEKLGHAGRLKWNSLFESPAPTSSAPPRGPRFVHRLQRNEIRSADRTATMSARGEQNQRPLCDCQALNRIRQARPLSWSAFSKEAADSV